jgi:protein N-terminal methyltransferase
LFSVLGGFEAIDSIDISSSHQLLANINDLNRDDGIVLDVGAGIGRVTRTTLSKFFKTIDLMDASPHLLEEAKRSLAHLSHQTRHFDAVEVKDFDFTGRVYDCVWVHWVVGYVPDPELISFLQRAKHSLRDERSVIVLKDNLSNNHKYHVMSEDNLTVRTEWHYLSVFEAAGLDVIQRTISQLRGDLFPVISFVLKPAQQ